MIPYIDLDNIPFSENILPYKTPDNSVIMCGDFSKIIDDPIFMLIVINKFEIFQTELPRNCILI